MASSYLWLDLIDSYRFPNKYVTPKDTVQVLSHGETPVVYNSLLCCYLVCVKRDETKFTASVINHDGYIEVLSFTRYSLVGWLLTNRRNRRQDRTISKC